MTEETNVVVTEKAETETDSEASSGSKMKLTEEKHPHRKWIFVTLVSLVLAAVIAGASIAASKIRTEDHPCMSTQRSDTWKMDFYELEDVMTSTTLPWSTS
jgi:hypothetical protein